MTWMCEVYYRTPSDSAREHRISGVVARHDGWLVSREVPEADCPQNICLTYEFAELTRAAAAAEELLAAGEYVEGPCEYT